MIFHENRLPADDSHEISCLICCFLKKQQNYKLSSAANYRLKPNRQAVYVHFQPAREMLFKWSFAGVAMVVRFYILPGKF